MLVCALACAGVAGVAVVPGVKLLLLGNGRVGKTQIARRLAGLDFEVESDSTHGIRIGDIALPGLPDTRLWVWDFGGQDIYHGTHVLFLRSPAVLAVVWADETEGEPTHDHGGLSFRNHPLPYWLDIARHQGHPASPTLLVQTRCDANAPESCNGLDDNCNGRIDEGCGYNGGGLQITASWQTDADINLVVTDPQNREVAEGHPAPGATLDQTANFNCVRSRPTLENAVWSAPRPPAGRYEVRLTAFDMCNAEETPVTVSISVGGRVVGTWRVPFSYARQEHTFAVTVR